MEHIVTYSRVQVEEDLWFTIEFSKHSLYNIVVSSSKQDYAPFLLYDFEGHPHFTVDNYTYTINIPRRVIIKERFNG